MNITEIYELPFVKVNVTFRGEELIKKLVELVHRPIKFISIGHSPF